MCQRVKDEEVCFLLNFYRHFLNLSFRYIISALYKESEISSGTDKNPLKKKRKMDEWKELGSKWPSLRLDLYSVLNLKDQNVQKALFLCSVCIWYLCTNNMYMSRMCFLQFEGNCVKTGKVWVELSLIIYKKCCCFVYFAVFCSDTACTSFAHSNLFLIQP